MKKKKIGLSLNKKTVSNLKSNQIQGGATGHDCLSAICTLFCPGTTTCGFSIYTECFCGESNVTDCCHK